MWLYVDMTLCVGNLLESKEDWQIILDNMATPPYTTPTDPEQAVDADKSDVGWLQLFMAHFTPTSLRRLLSGQLGQCLHGHDMQSLLLANTALHIQQRWALVGGHVSNEYMHVAALPAGVWHMLC